MENKKTPKILTLWDNIIYLKNTMKEARAIMIEKEKETQELTRDCTIMARERFISRLAHKNEFNNFEKRIAVFLLNGEPGEEALKAKFRVLQQLLEIYSKVEFITKGEI